MTEHVVASERLPTFIAIVDGVETDLVTLNKGVRICKRSAGSGSREPGEQLRVRLQLGSQSATPRRVDVWPQATNRLSCVRGESHHRLSWLTKILADDSLLF